MTHRYGYFIVICIEDWDNLTIGKEYKVGIYDIIEQGSVSEMYIVTNDLGYDEGIYSNVFKRKNIREIRDNKLKELGI